MGAVKSRVFPLNKAAIFFVGFLLLISSSAFAATHTWMQTMQSEFDAGTKTSVNTAVIPNSVIIDASNLTIEYPNILYVDASSCYGGYPASLAIDGGTGTSSRWFAAASQDGEWIRFVYKSDSYSLPAEANASSWYTGYPASEAMNGDTGTSSRWFAAVSQDGEYIKFVLQPDSYTRTGVSATASTSYSGYPASLALDGGTGSSSRWFAAVSQDGEWIKFTLGSSPVSVNGIKLYSLNKHIVNISYSNDDSLYTPLKSGVYLVEDGWNYFSWPSTSMKYIKVTVVDRFGNYPTISEFAYRSADTGTKATTGCKIYSLNKQVVNISASTTDDTGFAPLKSGVPLTDDGWNYFSWPSTSAKYIKVATVDRHGNYPTVSEFSYRTDVPAVGQTSGCWIYDMYSQVAEITVSDSDDRSYSEYYIYPEGADASSYYSDYDPCHSIDGLPSTRWFSATSADNEWIQYTTKADAYYNAAGAAASSYYSGYDPCHAIDGLPSTRWFSATNVDNEWIEFDLCGTSGNKSVNGIRIYGFYPQTINIQTKPDGESYSSFKTGFTLHPGWNYFSWGSPQTVRYVKVTVTDRKGNYPTIADFGYRSVDSGSALTQGARIWGNYAQTVSVSISNSDDTGFSSPVASGTLTADGWTYFSWGSTQTKYIRVTTTNRNGQYPTISEFGYRTGAHGLPQSVSFTAGAWTPVTWTPCATKYVKVRITNKNGQYPTINEFKFNGGSYPASGTLISSTKDTTASSSLGAISWDPTTQPPTCGTDSLKFQIASNNDNSTWSFIGPGGGTGYYTNPAGEAIWTGHSGNRYFRYKAILSTTDNLASPKFDDVSITYNTSPDAPANISPVSTATNEFNPLFTWSAFSDANSDGQVAVNVRLRPNGGTYGGAGSKDSGEVATTESKWKSSGWNLPNATYYWQVRVKDNSGWANNWSAWSTESSFTVNVQAPDPPTGVTAIPSTWETANSFAFNWTAPSVVTPKQPIAGYYYKTSGPPTNETDGTWTTGIAVSAYAAATLEGTNKFYVFAKDTVNNANPNNNGSVNFYWDSGPPSNPTSCAGWNSTGKTISLSPGSPYNYTSPYFEWSGASDGVGSGVHGYYIYYGTNIGADPETDPTKIYQTSPYYSASGMTVDNTYYLKIKTKDNAGRVSPGSYTAFTYNYSLTDLVPPIVTNVSTPKPSGGYGTGTLIPVTVSFNEAVVVNTSGGIPSLALNSGAIAEYSGGSGSLYLTFDYVIQKGQNVPDLDYVTANSLSLNGATIKDSANNSAVMTLPAPGSPNSLGGNKDIFIDSIEPTIEAIHVNGKRFLNNDIIPEGIMNNVTVEVMDQSGYPDMKMYVDSTPGSMGVATGGPVNWTCLGSFTSPSPGPHRLIFSASDLVGNSDVVTIETFVGGGAVQVVGMPLNFPNPFKPLSGGSDSKTLIQYNLSDDATITIIMYDITGQEVKRWSFTSGAAGGRSGINRIEWDGRTMLGEVSGNGMYIYKIISGDKAIGTGKIVVRD